MPVAKSEEQFKLEFQGEPSPAFYGIYLESEKGIMVDNYAIRGHSGDGLLRIPDSILENQCKKQNVKLFILQYGNNVIPYLDSIAECEYFERQYFLIFSKIKRLVPGASVLVIGAGDMLTQYHGNDITYPLLPAFRDAQKRAAERAGCAFWDLYEAMGGERSLLAWTENKLASKDGHFAPEGQRLIAARLFEDLITAYKKQQPHRPIEFLTFFAALCWNLAYFPSLKLFVSVIIDDAVPVGADSHRTNVGVMEKSTTTSIQ